MARLHAYHIIPGVNLCVGYWDILSLSDDHRLPYLLNELSRLRVDMVGLSETRRLGSRQNNSKGFTYYWLGMSPCQGGSPRYLQQTAAICVEVTLVDEHIMRLRLKHTGEH